MDNKIDHIDFLNSIEAILQEFTVKYMKKEFEKDVYCVFEYEDINKIFIENLAEPKPTFHFWHESPQNNRMTHVSQNTEGQKVNMSYSVYCVIDDTIEDNDKRKTVLNRYTSYFKHIFDNYQSELNEFMNVRVNLGSNDVNVSEDNSIYAMKQDLSFQVIKAK